MCCVTLVEVREELSGVYSVLPPVSPGMEFRSSGWAKCLHSLSLLMGPRVAALPKEFSLLNKLGAQSTSQPRPLWVWL